MFSDLRLFFWRSIWYFPSIVADRFGTNGYSTLWGVLTTGGVFSVSVFTDILGRDFKANTGDDDGNCKRECFATAILLWLRNIVPLLIFCSFWG